MNAVCDTARDPRLDEAVDTPRVLFLVRSLRQGGAERQLVALACGLHRRGWPVTVVCCYGGGVFQSELENAGVPLIDLHKRGRWDVAGFMWRLLRTLRQSDAEIVHGYMTLGNMLALLARVARPGTRVVWGVRSTIIDRTRRDWLSRLNFRLSRSAARLADGIIANSEAGAAHHASLGYPHARIKVIPNGIDTQRFRFDGEGRGRLRGEWRIDGGCTLVGLVGRIDPMKDHPTFLRAAALLAARDARLRFVCVGGGDPGFVQGIRALATQLGLDARITWAGPRNDMAAVFSALDIAVSSSCGEGFSNVIAEAMVCGRPCVVTDVGDSARIVGECGVVVGPGDPPALADAIERVARDLAQPGQAERLHAAARARIEDAYSLDALLRNSEQVLRALGGGTGRG
ncbi:MAG: Glycosyl transferase, group 1 [Rhodanobacteraceae bacterium]|nr:MAG: Glycosyl transferase, group 1 [Rhodanobacteraceae bacterium]